ncbi:hypothetical protein [Modestobacter sp. Leaf380]|uniref:hypothetical protein n=1 Tax=Modestobacter sp. Leaf380 TaxID=1736356 RepID=UPI0006F60C05|nr:hypothetical protein [Modestobacter sp. Leaf380]KQS68805.1 hypothetical protein ASG41_07820 [Modestobacter sp. Leaf380]
MHAVGVEVPARRARLAPCSIALVLVGTLLQRIALPLGSDQVPLGIPLLLGITALGVWTGEFRVTDRKLRALVVFIGTATVCTLLQVATGSTPSLLSLGLLFCIYPLVALTADIGRAGVAAVEEVFLRLMTVAALVSVGQLAVQYAGVPYEDHLLRVVPESLLLVGYNTGDPITYGDPLYRSNAVLFLEPSFISLFLGIAVALALFRRRSWLMVTVLLAGMIPPLAGSGFVVLAPALVVLALGRDRARLFAAVPAVVLAVLLALATPLGDLYLERSFEASNPNTSSSARLVQPYGALLPPTFEDYTTTLIGHGAGTADDYLIDVGLIDVTAPLVPKVLYEYGLVGAVGILALLVVFLAVEVRRRPWTVGIFLLFLYVNASFLQSTLVFITLFWISLMPPTDEPGDVQPEDLVHVPGREPTPARVG